jgi:phage FluMu gp28-like protein
MFNGHKTVAVLSKGEVEATEIIDRIRVMYDELPEFLKSVIKTNKGANNKHVFGFENKSLVKSRASGKQAGRSLSGSLLILDEAAFIEQIETIWAAVYPIISCVTKDTLILTDKGLP